MRRIIALFVALLALAACGDDGGGGEAGGPTNEVETTPLTFGDGPDPGFPDVTDLPTTTINVNAGRGVGALEVYALGFDDEQLTDDEQAARETVTALLDTLTTTGDAESYVPEEWLALTTATLEGARVVGPEPWPLDPDRAASVDTPAVCTRLTGDEVDQVRTVLLDGESEFVDTGPTVVEIALRPVLTGEETCNLGEFDEFVER